MKIVVDTHTHTVSSGHAYSTVQEMAREASANGVKAFVVSDHGPSLIGAPDEIHFWNLKVIPQELYGVRVVKGAEANIISYDGKIDISEPCAKRLEFVLASFHDLCISPLAREENTRAMIGALKLPYVDAVAHPGNPQFEVDIDEVVGAAKELNKLIEINNHSFYIRTGSEDNCRKFALKCKEMGVRVVCGSDAHFSFDVGRFDKVEDLLDSISMPEELVLNISREKFEAYIEERKARIKIHS